MEEKTIEILKEYVEKDVNITLESELIADLGLSSLDVINVVVAFEDEFGIEIPDEIIPTLSTVQDIVTYLQNNV